MYISSQQPGTTWEINSPIQIILIRETVRHESQLTTQQRWGLMRWRPTSRHSLLQRSQMEGISQFTFFLSFLQVDHSSQLIVRLIIKADPAGSVSLAVKEESLSPFIVSFKTLVPRWKLHGYFSMLVRASFLLRTLGQGKSRLIGNLFFGQFVESTQVRDCD